MNDKLNNGDANWVYLNKRFVLVSNDGKLYFFEGFVHSLASAFWYRRLLVSVIKCNIEIYEVI
jgi:hypothetical protein